MGDWRRGWAGGLRARSQGGRWEEVHLGDEGGGRFHEAELRMRWMPAAGGAQVSWGAGRCCFLPLLPRPQAAAQHLHCPEPSYLPAAARRRPSPRGSGRAGKL